MRENVHVYEMHVQRQSLGKSNQTIVEWDITVLRVEMQRSSFHKRTFSSTVFQAYIAPWSSQKARCVNRSDERRRVKLYCITFNKNIIIYESDARFKNATMSTSSYESHAHSRA